MEGAAEGLLPSHSPLEAGTAQGGRKVCTRKSNESPCWDTKMGIWRVCGVVRWKTNRWVVMVVVCG